MSKLILDIQQVSKQFAFEKLVVPVLHEVSLQVHEGDMLGIVGASGSGKSSLLNVIAGLDLPSSGSVHCFGQSLSQLSEAQRTQLRNMKMGFVYQFHHLLPEFTAMENVMMPLLIGGKAAQAHEAASAMLSRVGLSHRLSHRPAELSGGERQRVAIARALVNEPAVVFADEPTGNLDSQSASQIQQLMTELNQELSTAFVVVTHDLEFAKQLPQVIELKDGRLV